MGLHLTGIRVYLGSQVYSRNPNTWRKGETRELKQGSTQVGDTPPFTGIVEPEDTVNLMDRPGSFKLSRYETKVLGTVKGFPCDRSNQIHGC